MGACYHIDTVTCPICKPENGADQVLSMFFHDRERVLANMQGYTEEINKYHYRTKAQSQQDQQWQDLAGL